MTHKTSDPNRFRSSYYGARYYIDPLPSCLVADATEERWPAVSTIKKAWTGPFSKKHSDGVVYPLDALRVAKFADANWQTLADDAERISAMAASATADLAAASGRGTAVHTMIEDLINGATTLWPGIADEYSSACQAIVDDLDMELIASEVVVIRRGDDESCGWGGTVDAIARIGDKTYVIDWKSRGADSNHGAYDTEAAQVGAYASADYVLSDGHWDEVERVAMPKIDGALIVSIRPDSYALYPIDIEPARDAARSLASTWEHKRQGSALARKAIGPEATAAELISGNAPAKKTRKKAAPKPKATVTPISETINATRPTATALPDEGKDLGEAARQQALDNIAKILTPIQIAALTTWSHRGWTMAGTAHQTERRWTIAGAAARLVALAWEDDAHGVDDDLARALLAAAMNDDGIRQPAVKIADALGSLTIAEAEIGRAHV